MSCPCGQDKVRCKIKRKATDHELLLLLLPVLRTFARRANSLQFFSQSPERSEIGIWRPKQRQPPAATKNYTVYPHWSRTHGSRPLLLYCVCTCVCMYRLACLMRMMPSEPSSSGWSPCLPFTPDASAGPLFSTTVARVELASGHCGYRRTTMRYLVNARWWFVRSLHLLREPADMIQHWALDGLDGQDGQD